MTKKAVLVDGSGFIYRSYYASPKLTTVDGQPVGAVYGFCAMLIHLLQHRMSDVFVIVLDCGRDTFRPEIYPQYKANRSETPDDLKLQFPLIQEACEAFGISTISKKGFEADDIIATYACDLASKNCDVEIVSSDKDLMQLISDRISIFDAMHSKTIIREDVIGKYGVPPELMTQLQALMGDSVDNIPGVAGVGPKTAAKLILQYNTLDNLYNHIDEITPLKLRDKLLNDKDNAFISLKLVTLLQNVDVEKKYTSVHYSSGRIKEFLRKYNFTSLLNRVDRISPCISMF